MAVGDVVGSRFAATDAKKRGEALPIVGQSGSGSGPGQKGRPVATRGAKPQHPFLPMNRADLDARGWDEVDIVIVSGDAYVDHPAFGPPLIARFLEARGFRVGILAQPDWQSPEPFRALGRPRLFYGVAAGNMDSMLNRLTAQKKNRSEDQYSPGGRTGCRPDRASLVYANRCKEAYPDVPVVLGGIEASLRRIAHYDYWSDKVRRSILLDAKADLLIYGMGERPVWEVARRLAAGESIEQLHDIRGTGFIVNRAEAERIAAEPSRFTTDGKVIVLPSYEEVSRETPEGKEAYARMARAFQHELNPGNGRPVLQRHGERAVYFNPPSQPIEDGPGRGEPTSVGMDELYDLPFNRVPHPSYTETIPAYETVKHSIVALRGCFGGCTFCSITEHEGRIIQNRSAESILREVRELRRMGDFRGTITDLGGPTANMYKMKCRSEDIESRCRKLSCVHPGVCENLVTDHGPVIDLMREVRDAEGVNHVFIASGVRYDLAELSPNYVRELAKHHVGGHLSVAPEHVSPRVLEKMKKPGIESYERFKDMFSCASQNAKKDQYEIPYFVSGHPGSTLEDMVETALWLKTQGYRPRQVQDFIPTPMSMASAMYYSGIDPLTMTPVYSARGLREKRLQKSLLLYWDKEQWPLVREALTLAKRTDLIGFGPKCLVPPEENTSPPPARPFSPGRPEQRRPAASQGPNAGKGPNPGKGKGPNPGKGKGQTPGKAPRTPARTGR